MNLLSPEYIKDKTEFNKIFLLLKNSSLSREDDVLSKDDFDVFFTKFDNCINKICIHINYEATHGYYKKSFVVNCNNDIKDLILKLMYIVKNIFVCAGYKVIIKKEIPELTISWEL